MSLRERYVDWLRSDGPGEVGANLAFSLGMGLAAFLVASILVGLFVTAIVSLWVAVSPLLAGAVVALVLLAARFLIGVAREARS